jgi:hypothetical protein
MEQKVYSTARGFVFSKTSFKSTVLKHIYSKPASKKTRVLTWRSIHCVLLRANGADTNLLVSPTIGNSGR